jgi:chromosome segregation ATPase
VERVQELESALRQRDFDRQETEAKVTLLEQSAQNYRNEINFWNGKCSNLRRDVEYQERHLTRYKDENSKLMNECDYLKVRAENLEREVMLLRRQVSGLQEDNERINRMYQVVEREATFTTGTRTQQENIQHAGNISYRSGEDKMTMRNGGNGGKWKVVEDDNFAISTGNFSQNQFYPTAATNQMIG